MIERELSAVLHMLGDTEDEIAKNLGAMGRCGIRGDREFCVVADFLSMLGFSEIEFCPSGSLLAYDEWLPLELSGGLLPQPLCEFAANFDAGKYPELEVGCGW